MSDITMCYGGDCPLKEKCKRNKAKPCKWHQSYFVIEPFEDGKCDYFIEDLSEEKI